MSNTSNSVKRYFDDMNRMNYTMGLQMAEKLSKYFEVDVEPLEAIFDKTKSKDYIWTKINPNTRHKTNDSLTQLDKENLPKKSETDRLMDEYDFVISLGGDGTFLSCSHLIPDTSKYLLGINSSPNSLGYLNNFKYEEFMRNVESICKRMVNEEYSIVKRRRFFCQFDAAYDSNKRILGLNDIFIGTDNQASSFRYDFKVDDEWYRNLKSTGCLIYTGTGSSAWARSLHHINNQKLENIFDFFNEKADSERIKELQNFIDERYTISSDSNFLSYLHNELVLNGDDLKFEGIGCEFMIKSHTVNGFVGIDGFYYKLDMGKEVRVSIAEDDKSLSCFAF